MIDKIKQIKYLRLKPEEKWFLDLITDLEEDKSVYNTPYFENVQFKYITEKQLKNKI